MSYLGVTLSLHYVSWPLRGLHPALCLFCERPNLVPLVTFLLIPSCNPVTVSVLIPRDLRFDVFIFSFINFSPKPRVHFEEPGFRRSKNKRETWGGRQGFNHGCFTKVLVLGLKCLKLMLCTGIIGTGTVDRRFERDTRSVIQFVRRAWQGYRRCTRGILG